MKKAMRSAIIAKKRIIKLLVKVRKNTINSSNESIVRIDDNSNLYHRRNNFV